MTNFKMSRAAALAWAVCLGVWMLSPSIREQFLESLFRHSEVMWLLRPFWMLDFVYFHLVTFGLLWWTVYHALSSEPGSRAIATRLKKLILGIFESVPPTSQPAPEPHPERLSGPAEPPLGKSTVVSSPRICPRCGLETSHESRQGWLRCSRCGTSRQEHT